jgi:hypothetical protein
MIGSLAQALLSVDLNLPMKGVVTLRLGRVAVVVGRVAKVLECIVCTLGRAARSDKIVLGILDAIVYMYVMDCCYRRLSHYG